MNSNNFTTHLNQLANKNKLISAMIPYSAWLIMIDPILQLGFEFLTRNAVSGPWFLRAFSEIAFIFGVLLCAAKSEYLVLMVSFILQITVNLKRFYNFAQISENNGVVYHLAYIIFFSLLAYISYRSYSKTSSLDKLKRLCPYCGTQNLPKVGFCSGCGKALPENPAIVQPPVVAAPAAVVEAPVAVAAAPAAVVAAPAAVVAAPVAVVEAPVMAVQTTPENVTFSAPSKKCSLCGAILNAEAVFCKDCGARVDEAAATNNVPLNSDTPNSYTQPNVDTIEQSDLLTCPVCSTKNISGSVFCKECGNRFDSYSDSTEICTAPQQMCQNCGAIIPENANTCPECNGKRI
ncbi:MAG: zinc ribbon domain-containing protein [Christensenella sp.]